MKTSIKDAYEIRNLLKSWIEKLPSPFSSGSMRYEEKVKEATSAWLLGNVQVRCENLCIDYITLSSECEQLEEQYDYLEKEYEKLKKEKVKKFPTDKEAQTSHAMLQILMKYLKENHPEIDIQKVCRNIDINQKNKK